MKNLINISFGNPINKVVFFLDRVGVTGSNPVCLTIIEVPLLRDFLFGIDP